MTDMVQLMIKTKFENQKLIKPGRSWRLLRAPVSTMSLPGVTLGSRWRNPLNFKKPACSESQEDLLALDGYWGYCSPSCSGELPSPTSKYSIARSLSPRYPGPQVLVTAQVQPHNAPQPLEPGTLRPLHLGIRHLLHLRSACGGDFSHCRHPTIKTQTWNEKAFIFDQSLQNKAI